MRKLLAALILLLVSVAAATWLRAHDGFVLVRVGEWTVQVSLLIAVAVLVAVWLVVSALIGLARRTAHSPRAVRAWAGERRHRKSRHELVKGLMQVAEGRNAAAELTLVRHVGDAEVPLLHHLFAAVAAHRRQAWKTRDEHLAEADRSTPGARNAVGLLQAQLQCDAEQWEQALATLRWLREQVPGNARALALLAKCLEAVGDYAQLADLLPELRRRQALPPERLVALEARILRPAMEAEAEVGGGQLKEMWRGLTREQRREPALREIYATALIRAGRTGEAENELRRWMRKDLDERVVRAWGRLGQATGDVRFLRQTERWLQGRPEDLALLEAAGRQAAACSQWERARNYLEAAATRTGRSDLHALLGELYERLDETENARRAYRRALSMDPGRNSLPVIEQEPVSEQGSTAGSA